MAGLISHRNDEIKQSQNNETNSDMTQRNTSLEQSRKGVVLNLKSWDPGKVALLPYLPTNLEENILTL